MQEPNQSTISNQAHTSQPEAVNRTPVEPPAAIGVANQAAPLTQDRAQEEKKSSPGAIIVGLLVAIPLLILSPFLEFLEEVLPIFKNKWVLAGLFVLLVFVALYIVGSGQQATVAGGR